MKSYLSIKRFGLIVIAFALALMTACAPSPASPTPTPTPTSTSSPSPTSTASPTASPTPINPADLPGYVEASAVDSQWVNFMSAGFNIKAYLSKPKTADSFPGLIIIHENRGLTPHIEDVARRYANQGYAVIAPDLLSRVGGTAQFATTDEAVAAIGTLSSEGVMQDVSEAFNYLKSLGYVQKDRIGVLGYCWGGGNSLLFATRNQELKACVVYYGPNPANIDDVAKITAPVLGLYGAEDTRITMNVPALEEAMKKYNKSFESKTYPGAAHAFFNDTGTRYHAESAKDAWSVTNAFLARVLKN